MYIRDFDWLIQILDKLLSKHNVTQVEVEEVFLNRPMYRFVECTALLKEGTDGMRTFILQVDRLKQDAT